MRDGGRYRPERSPTDDGHPFLQATRLRVLLEHDGGGSTRKRPDVGPVVELEVGLPERRPGVNGVRNSKDPGGVRRP